MPEKHSFFKQPKKSKLLCEGIIIGVMIYSYNFQRNFTCLVQWNLWLWRYILLCMWKLTHFTHVNVCVMNNYICGSLVYSADMFDKPVRKILLAPVKRHIVFYLYRQIYFHELLTMWSWILPTFRERLDTHTILRISILVQKCMLWLRIPKLLWVSTLQCVRPLKFFGIEVILFLDMTRIQRHLNISFSLVMVCQLNIDWFNMNNTIHVRVFARLVRQGCCLSPASLVMHA